MEDNESQQVQMTIKVKNSRIFPTRIPEEKTSKNKESDTNKVTIG